MDIGECAICSNEFESLSQVSPILLTCGHIICISCKENWFDINSRINCPECDIAKTTSTRSFIELDNSFQIIDKLYNKYTKDTILMERIHRYKELLKSNNKPNILNQLKEMERKFRTKLLNDIEPMKNNPTVSDYGNEVLQFNNHCKTSNIAYTDGLFYRCILFIPNIDISIKQKTAPFLVFNCCQQKIICINLLTEEQTYIENIGKQITHCDANDFDDGLILCSNYTKCVYLYEYKTNELISTIEHSMIVKIVVFDKEVKNTLYILDPEDCIHMIYSKTRKLKQSSFNTIQTYKGIDSIETITSIGKYLLLVKSKQHLVLISFIEHDKIKVFDLGILFKGLENRPCLYEINKEVSINSKPEIKEINFYLYKYKVVQRIDNIYIGVLYQKDYNSNSIHTGIFELHNNDNVSINFKCKLYSEKIIDMANNRYCFIPIRIGPHWYIPVRSKIDNMISLLDLENERFLYLDIKVEGVYWDVELIYKKEDMEFMVVKFKDKTVFIAMGTGEEFRIGNHYKGLCLGPLTCSSTVDSDNDKYSYGYYVDDTM